VVDRQRLFAFLAETSFFREEAVDSSPNRVSLEKQDYWQSFALEGVLFFSLLFVIVLCCFVV
jgi:hypothetical protein